MWTGFQFFYQRKNFLYMHRKDYHLACNMVLHYLVKFDNPKMLPNFHFERDNN